MNSRPGRLSLISAVILTGAAAFFLIQRHSVVTLRRDHQALLREQAGQLAELAADHERLSNLAAQAAAARALAKEQTSELLRLRAEVAGRRREDQDLQRLNQANRRRHDALAPSTDSRDVAAATDASSEYFPKESWAFAGYATPEASLQSGLWAANSGDIQTFLSSITGDMRDHVQKDLENKTEAEAGARAKAEVAPLKSCRILAREFVSNDEVVLTVSMQEEEKATTTKLTMKRLANEWRLSGTGDDN